MEAPIGALEKATFFSDDQHKALAAIGKAKDKNLKQSNKVQLQDTRLI